MAIWSHTKSPPATMTVFAPAKTDLTWRLPFKYQGTFVLDAVTVELAAEAPRAVPPVVVPQRGVTVAVVAAEAGVVATPKAASSTCCCALWMNFASRVENWIG